MKKIWISISLLLIVSSLQAGDRFADITKEYLYNKNHTISIDIRKVIASDPRTASKTLNLLLNDPEASVRKLAQDNIYYQ